MPPFVPGAAPRHADSPDAAPAEPYEPEPADDLQLTSDRPSKPRLDSGATSDPPTLEAEAPPDSETTPYPEPPRDPEPLNAEPWAGAVELDSVDAEPWAGTPEPAPQAPGDDPAPWDTPDAWAESVEEHPDVGPAEPDTSGAPSGALPEAFFADAFYTPHMIEQSEVDDARDAEQVMAEQVAERLADLSRQIRERGFSALAETVDPDQLSRIIAGIVAGFVARVEPDG
jgi:hypothetical protein